MTITCRTCGHDTLSLEFDPGAAAFCVDSPTSADAARSIAKHSFNLGSCSACGVIQLLNLPPLEALRPPGQAIQYRDPERHLDDLARVVVSLVKSPSAKVVGMTYKDVPLMNRLAERGMSNLKLLDRDEDWGLGNPRFGIETIQTRCTVDWADSMRGKHGPIDLLLVRHVLEHGHNFPEFIAACRRLTEPNGLVLFEVPGCETELARGDAGALWEEHVSYFTADSLRRSLTSHGFQPVVVGNYPYTIEDCLVTIGCFGSANSPIGQVESPLLQEFDKARSRIRDRILEMKSIAVYGAGHRTTTWIELTGLGGVVECVIDDDPAKQRRFVPGSGIPVGPSSWLVDRNVRICVGLLSSEIIRKIAAREIVYANRGGRFMTLEQIHSGLN